MSNFPFDNISYNNDNYFVRDTKLYLVEGTQTAATNLWKGSLPEGISSYENGLSIDYYLPQAGTTSAATLQLGSLDPKPVYVAGANPVTTHFPQYSIIRLTYLVKSGLNSGQGCWEVVSAITGDGDTKVKQKASTDNAVYEVLLAGTTSTSTETGESNKSVNFTYNPSTKAMNTGGAINGITLATAATGFTISGGTESRTLTVGGSYTLHGACAKSVDNSIADASTSTNLPTSQAVAAFVEGKGYTTNTGTVTGTGTTGYLAKWSSGSGITNGPAFTSGGTKFLKQDGTWGSPTVTEIPKATDSSLGGIKVGYNTSGGNIKVQLDANGNAYVAGGVVTQNSATTTSGAFPIILGFSTATSAVTNTVNKASTLTYNPSTQGLVAGKSVAVGSWKWDSTVTSGHFTLTYTS